MSLRRWLAKIAAQEDLNFLLTNRIPRRALTRLVGWLSHLEQPLVSRLSLAVWQAFTRLELEDAEQTTFKSMHECFVRKLRPGTRPVDPDPRRLCSPCDAIVGAHGRIEGTRLIQTKGAPYTLEDLLLDPALVTQYRDGSFVTLRITSAMYHRFHAPHDCTVERVDYVFGDTWNVNPIALARVPRLFCKNERAVIRTRLDGGALITLVPVAAILVAGIRLHFLDLRLHLGYRGPATLVCDTRLRKGEEMGWFEHGSTIIVFAPAGFEPCSNLREGAVIRMGQPLLRCPV